MEDVCLICTDKIKGKVTLECGHSCCATCFAKHSRVNNKCPFCRAVFAPPVIKKEKMSIEVAQEMASLTLRQSRDLCRELLRHPCSIQEITLHIAVRAIMNTVNWYDTPSVETINIDNDPDFIEILRLIEEEVTNQNITLPLLEEAIPPPFFEIERMDNSIQLTPRAHRDRMTRTPREVAERAAAELLLSMRTSYERQQLRRSSRIAEQNNGNTI